MLVMVSNLREHSMHAGVHGYTNSMFKATKCPCPEGSVARFHNPINEVVNVAAYLSAPLRSRIIEFLGDRESMTLARPANKHHPVIFLSLCPILAALHPTRAKHRRRCHRVF